MVTVDLRKWKDYLQRCDIMETAAEVGITTDQASKVMSGKSTNWEFARRIFEKAQRNKALKDQIESI